MQRDSTTNIIYHQIITESNIVKHENVSITNDSQPTTQRQARLRDVRKLLSTYIYLFVHVDYMCYFKYFASCIYLSIYIYIHIYV